jgi:nanoRNase/pAp phosphatase (c-di-AMP/oligoRNAs hydrolase)
MARRLFLGCGSIGHAVLEAAGSLPGSTTILATDPSRVEALRSEGIAAEQADVTDPSVIGGRDPAVVIVIDDDPSINQKATMAASQAYPDAQILAYPGQHPSSEQRRSIGEAADRLIRPGAYLLDTVAAFLEGEQSSRAQQLREVLASIDGTLGVVTHDNPDPDAIASAVALVAIAEHLGTDAEAGYFGEISHQENRAFVNLLDVEITRFEESVPDYDAIALVDHSRPGINDQLPRDTPIDIVIDHHPTVEEVSARFVDHRPGVGATSTILAGYLRQFVTEPPMAVATALLYGIRVDTDDFQRDIAPEDFEAVADLLPYADTDVLERVESPSMSADTMDTIAGAIKRREVRGSTLATCVGPIADRDTLAQAADRLLEMEGVTTTLVSGFTDGVIYLSGRSRRKDFDLGAAMRDAFDDLGSAGGHTDMAGAQIPMGVLGELGHDDEVRLADIVEGVVADRFFAVMDAYKGTVPQAGSTPSEQDSGPTQVVRRVVSSDGPASVEDEDTPSP